MVFCAINLCSIDARAQKVFAGKAVRSGYGIRCAIDGGGFTPPIYRVADLGKPGVPILDRAEMREVKTIRKYVKAPTLSFVMMPLRRDGRMVIFDPANRELCANDTGSEFYVLNGTCNELYYPAQYGIITNAATGCQAPRPWVRGEATPRAKAR